MFIECPSCDHYNELDCEDLPSHACDDTDFECKNCEHVFSIGWYATAELRNNHEQENQLTMEQALIVSGYTGIMAVPNFSILHEEIENRMGRPVLTHELANEDTFDTIKSKFKDDFLKLIPTPPTEGE